MNYYRQNTKLYIDEPAAETVRYIFNLFVGRLGPTKIAKRLRDEKIVTPTEYFYSIGKKRIGELDKLIKSTFEQHILGSLEEDRYKSMVCDCEDEQRKIK